MADRKIDDRTKLTMLQILLDYLTKTQPLRLVVHMLYIVIVCTALSVSYVIAFHWTSLVDIYEEAHNITKFSDNFKTSADADNKINQMLGRVLTENNAMRAYVYRYHNGLAAISGVPFFFQTNTHELIAPGASRLMSFEQRIPASIHIAMNNAFVTNQCYAISDTTLDKNSQDYYIYTSRNAIAMIRCPIYMSNGDLFGFVGLDFNRIHEFPTKEISELHDIAESLGSIFESTVKK